RGLNASPGAASGKVVLDADTAEQRGLAGEDVILVRWETTPDDIHGLIQAKGILTAHGGMTSHAAVVARGMGKPCVAGCEGLTIDADARTLTIGGQKLSEGDVITIDGGTGRVIVGSVDLVPPQINEDFETILGWADDLRRLKVRANADTPEDAAKARAGPRSTRCRCARSSGRRRRSRSAPVRRRSSRSCTRLSASPKSCTACVQSRSRPRTKRASRWSTSSGR